MSEPIHDGNGHNGHYEARSALEKYMSEMAETPLLTRDEETALAKRVTKGDLAAREHMIKANLRFVVKIAREYEDTGMPLLDLINEGNIGLMKAVERFRINKGAKLSTYAAWWIKHYIRRALSAQLRTIRIPVHAISTISHIGRVTSRLSDELGYQPSDEEVAAELGISAERVSKLKQANISPIRLDAKINDDGDATIGDMIEDDSVDDPAEQAGLASETARITSLLRILPDRERTIIRMRFGLDNRESKSLEEVGSHFKITRERTRQLQVIALLKIRNHINGKTSHFGRKKPKYKRPSRARNAQ